MTGISVGGRRPCIKSTFLAAGDGMAGWRSSPRRKGSRPCLRLAEGASMLRPCLCLSLRQQLLKRLQRNKHVAVADVSRFRFGHRYNHSCHALNQHSQRFWCGISQLVPPERIFSVPVVKQKVTGHFPVTRHGSLAIPRNDCSQHP